MTITTTILEEIYFSQRVYLIQKVPSELVTQIEKVPPCCYTEDGRISQNYLQTTSHSHSLVVDKEFHMKDQTFANATSLDQNQ